MSRATGREGALPPARGCRLSPLTPPSPPAQCVSPLLRGEQGHNHPVTERADLGGCPSQDFAAQSHAPRLCLHVAACRARRGPWNLPEAPLGTCWLPPAFARTHLVPHYHGSRGQMARSEGSTLHPGAAWASRSLYSGEQGAADPLPSHEPAPTRSPQSRGPPTEAASGDDRLSWSWPESELGPAVGPRPAGVDKHVDM